MNVTECIDLFPCAVGLPLNAFCALGARCCAVAFFLTVVVEHFVTEWVVRRRRWWLGGNDMAEFLDLCSITISFSLVFDCTLDTQCLIAHILLTVLVKCTEAIWLRGWWGRRWFDVTEFFDLSQGAVTDPAIPVTALNAFCWVRLVLFTILNKRAITATMGGWRRRGFLAKALLL